MAAMNQTETQSAESTGKEADYSESTPATIHAKWLNEINTYEKSASNFEKRGVKICKRYRDERGNAERNNSKFNILWSNVQTLLPALYATNPKPDIERRFLDKDALGLMSSRILERSTSYFINDVFGNCMRQTVLDRLLPGRGTAWVRYVPHFRDAEVNSNEEVADEGFQISEDAESEAKPQEAGEKPQEVYYEEVVPDYVHWQDFGHTVARTWEEVTAIWRKVYLDRRELTERFGKELALQIPLDYAQKDINDQKITEYNKKATIYEIWDKKEKQAIWVHKDYPAPLDILDDPLGLEDFFPCPRPLLASTANDSVIPVADYAQYQDQARELDELTARIASLTKAVKVAGVYDASAEGVANMLTQGIENKLVPIEQWAMLSEKGGVKGVVDYFPIEMVLNTLIGLYEARDKVKNDLYEISGIADIIRGATKPNETATAQRIKGQYATLRLSANQDEVSRFARDLVSIIAQIIAKHFSIETIKEVSGVKLMTQQEKLQFQQQQQMQAQQYQRAAAMAQQQGAQPPAPPPPPPEELLEALNNPTWEEVDALLKNTSMRCFKIAIETDSTIKSDQQEEQQGRVQFLDAAGKFLQQASAIGGQVPELVPLLNQMLMFGVRGFKAGKELESAFDIAMKKLEKKAENPPPPPPDPAMAKIQADAEARKQQMAFDTQKAQADMGMKQQQHQQDLQLEQASNAAKLQFEQAKAEADMQLRIKEMQQAAEIEMQKMRAEAERDIAKMQAEQALASAQLELERQKAAQEIELKRMELEAKIQLDKYTADLNAQRESERAASEDSFKRETAQADGENRKHIELVKVALQARGGAADVEEGPDMTALLAPLTDAIKAMTAPKNIQVSRGKDGKLTGKVTTGGDK